MPYEIERAIHVLCITAVGAEGSEDVLEMALRMASESQDTGRICTQQYLIELIIMIITGTELQWLV